MAWSKVFDFSEPSDCQAVSRCERREFIPTGRGRFRAEITQVGIGGLLVHQLHFALAQVSIVAIKPGYRSIEFLTRPGSPFLHGGREVSPSDIVVIGSDAAHQRSGPALHYGTISLAIDVLVAAVQTMIDRELSQEPQIVRPHFALAAQLLSLHKNIVLLARNNPDVLEFPQVVRALESELIHVVARCLAEGVRMESTTGSRRHDAIVVAFEDFLAANLHRPLYLVEVCAALGVAERTLRASCQEHLGMGPVRYLALRRMHLVRRILLASDPTKTTVTQVITDHGFWELGRFSVAYKLLFGEPPTATLRRPAEQPKLRLNRPSSLAVAILPAV